MPQPAVSLPRPGKADAGDEKPLAIRPITPSLGVNPEWAETGAEPEPLEIPSYQGVQEITQMALMLTLWSGVERFLYEECGVIQLDEAKEEKKHLSILRESETSVLCLLCLLNNEAYSAGGLVDAMIGQTASADQRGNARKRIIARTLPVIADRYGLLQYRENHRGGQREYQIARTKRLALFAQHHLASGVRQIVGGQFSCGNSNLSNSIDHPDGDLSNGKCQSSQYSNLADSKI